MSRSHPEFGIVIDPGHGGSDPGCVHDGLNEKDIALRFAQQINTEFGDRMTLRRWMTRNEDRFMALSDRVTFANKRDADAFLSVHVNTAATDKPSGMWLIYDDKSTHGPELAETIQAHLLDAGFKCDVVVPDGTPHVGDRQLAVLSNTNMPAVLLELGFITNHEDRALLTGRDDSRPRVAKAIVDALQEWASPDAEKPVEERVASLEERVAALESIVSP